MVKDAPSTWKEWAIRTEVESDATKEDVVDLYEQLEKLKEKHQKLSDAFLKLETKVYFIMGSIPIIIGIFEFVMKLIEK
jgi:hypothetical protein